MPNFIKTSVKGKSKDIDLGVTSGVFLLPYAGLSPKDYQIKPSLFAFQAVLDQHLEIFFKGEIDEFNSSVLDNLLNDIATGAVEDINLQFIEHMQLIRNLGAKWEGDYREAQLKLEDYKAEFATTEATLDEARAKFKAINTGAKQSHENQFVAEGGYEHV